MKNITEQEFRTATAMPRLTEVPDDFQKVLTPAAKKAHEAREAAYQSWVDAEDDAQAAWIAVADAEAKDTQALRDAVAAGKSDPGTKNEDRARRAVVVAVEKVRQAKQAVDTADRAWRRHVDEAMPSYLPVLAQQIRDARQQWADTAAAAQADIEHAGRQLIEAEGRAHFVKAFCAPVVGFTPSAQAPTVQFPRLPGELDYAEALADTLERVAAHHGTLPAERYDHGEMVEPAVS